MEAEIFEKSLEHCLGQIPQSSELPVSVGYNIG